MADESNLPTVLRKKLPPNLEKIKNGHYAREDLDYPVHMYLKENDIRVDETGSDVVAFLRGKNVLITGATGFLGKMLVEKLLRCCKDIGTIYIIVRTKKGATMETRMKEYLNNLVFVRLGEIYPNFKEKIVGISGDIEQDGLGLSEESRKLLIQKVNIIFHVAATVRFDEKLRKAVKINVQGTQEMIRLAKECDDLAVLTHVSTAYSNCIHKKINEDFYPPLIDPQSLIEIMDKLSDDTVDKITPGLIGDYPNTYTFTKQLTEDVIRNESNGLPMCIQRPSVVIASVREPIRSWVDSIYGPVGLILAVALGLAHIMLGNPKAKTDVVPVDYVINNCIVAAYKTAKERNTEKTQIFNCTNSDKSALFWVNLGQCRDQGCKVASRKMLSQPFFRLSKYWYWFLFVQFFLHTVPAYIFDFVAIRLGHQPRLIKGYAKINKFLDTQSFFLLNEWSFDSTNTDALWASLNEQDKKIFPFDMSTLVWEDYFETYLVAGREFLLNDYLDTLDQGRAYYRRLTIIQNVTLGTTITLTTYFFINSIFCFVPLTIISIFLFYLLTDYK